MKTTINLIATISGLFVFTGCTAKTAVEWAPANQDTVSQVTNVVLDVVNNVI